MLVTEPLQFRLALLQVKSATFGVCVSGHGHDHCGRKGQRKFVADVILVGLIIDVGSASVQSFPSLSSELS